MTIDDTSLDPDQLSEFYRTSFVAMNQGFCVLEKVETPSGQVPDFRYLLINPAFEQQAGLEQVVGKTIRQVVPGVEERILAHYQGVALTGDPVQFDEYVTALDMWIDEYAFRIEQQPARIAVLFTNSTARKQAQAALLQREKRQAFLLELSDALRPLADPVAIQETVTHTAMTYFEADRCYYCEIEGSTAIIRRDAGRPGQSSVAGVYSLDNMPLFKAVVEAGRPFVVRDANTADILDDPIRQLCLQMQVISFVGVPLIKNDQPVGMLCITQDTPRDWLDDEVELAQEIAERTWAAVERTRADEARRGSDERLRELIQNLPDYAIFRIDAQGFITEWTEGAQRVKGYTPQEAIGQHLALFYTPEERAAGEPGNELRQAARTGRVEREGLRIRKGGQRFWVNEIATAIHDMDGQVVGFTKISRDITQRKQAELTLRESEEHFRLTIEAAQMSTWDWNLVSDQVAALPPVCHETPTQSR